MTGRRHAAVLVLREIAYCMPTFFFQNVQQFFDVIFHAIYDPKPGLRESGANALRMALVVTSQRETSSQAREQSGSSGGGHSYWYQQCFNQVTNHLPVLDQSQLKLFIPDQLKISILQFSPSTDQNIILLTNHKSVQYCSDQSLTIRVHF